MSIIITGASGYVGQHILAELLSHNDSRQKVVAIVRSQSAQDKLTQLFPNTPNLTFEIVPELDAPHALDAVLDAHQDATTYVSTALVVSFTADDPAAEIIDPSINIVRNTLESIRDHAPGIKRVVLTSSSASVVGPDKAFGYAGKYAEDDWSPLTYEMGKTNGTMAYFVAKKLAERAAWDFVKENENKDDVKFDVVAIMPGLIVGPARFDSEVTKDSQPSTAGMIGGLLKLGPDGEIPPMAAGAVDVRDVAKVHGLAVREKKFGNQRVLLESDKLVNDNVIEVIREKFPEWKDKLPVPKPVSESEFVRPDDRKPRDLIGFKLRGLDESVVDLVKQIDAAADSELIDRVEKLKV